MSKNEDALTDPAGQTIEQKIPVRYRGWIYSALQAVAAIQLAFNVIDGAIWGRVMSAVTLLGFQMARKNTAA